MARFNAKEIENYAQSSNGSSFFKLENDGDLATVRFMYNTVDDVQGYAVHEIEVGGKKRYVNCLREYNDPIDMCPLCKARYRVLTKLFVMLYDVNAEEVKIWDRGRTFYSKLSSLCNRYNPLVSVPFEIERNGKKGETSTKYETYPLERDNTTLDDLPEVPELLGTLILDKSVEELEYFLEYGEFPADDKAPQGSTRPAARPAQPTEEPPVRRRTPATSSTYSSRRPGSGNTDRF